MSKVKSFLAVVLTVLFLVPGVNLVDGTDINDEKTSASSICTPPSQIAGAYTPRAPISIINNDNFTSANGVVKGTGSPWDPYIISGWDFNWSVSAPQIYIENTTVYFVIKNCYIHGNVYPINTMGISFKDVSNGMIANNTISGKYYRGIYMISQNNDTNNNFVTNNTITGNQVGIWIHANGAKPVDNFIIYNWIYNNTDEGVVLGNTWYNYVTNNQIESNGHYGIILHGTVLNEVMYNRIASNVWGGIEADGATEVNSIYHNDFINNFGNTTMVGSVDNIWNNTQGGNYWSDYESKYPSATNDGTFWDTPYLLGGMTGATDDRPLVNTVLPSVPYLNTPNTNRTAGDNINFTWQESAGTGQITYNVFLDIVNPPTVKVGSKLTVPYCCVNVTDGKKYYWYVDAVNENGRTSSPTWSFTQNTPPSPSPSPISPITGATKVPIGNCTVKWENSTADPEGDNITYYWYVSENQIVNFPYYANGTTSANESSVFIAQPNTTYYWQVKAWDGYEFSEMSNGGVPWNFTTTGGDAWPVVVLFSPDGGELLRNGTPFNITWNVTDDETLPSNPIKLQFTRDAGSTWHDINNSFPNNGTYPWIIPDGINSTECAVRVICTDSVGHEANDTSNSTFTITNYTAPPDISPTVTVLSPNGGELWNWSTVQEIQWNATDDNPLSDSCINISYSMDNGTTWAVVDSNLANNGSYTWIVPDGVNSSECLIRVTCMDSTNQTAADESNSTFTIHEEVIPPVDDPPSVSVLYPKTGYILYGGENETIRWNATDDNPLPLNCINISYSLDNGVNWTSVVKGVNNTGSFVWLVPRADTDQILDPDEIFTEQTTAYQSSENLITGSSRFAAPTTIPALGEATVWIEDISVYGATQLIISPGITQTEGATTIIILGNTNDHEMIVDAFDYTAGKTYDLSTSMFINDLYGHYDWYLTIQNPYSNSAGSIDSFEMEISGTSDPNNPDTDNDGLTDYVEVMGWQWEVNGQETGFASSPVNSNSDNDGLSDLQEYNGWTISVRDSDNQEHGGIAVKPNPQNSDTDGDGLTDMQECQEEAGEKTDPANTDTDNDGLTDNNEVYMLKYATRDQYIIPDCENSEYGVGKTDELTVSSSRIPYEVEAWIGIVHPDTMDLQVKLYVGKTPQDTASYTLSFTAEDTTSNLYASYDLLSSPFNFQPEKFTDNSAGNFKWWLEVTDTVDNLPQDVSQYIDYFEIHLTIRTNPCWWSSDNDLLSDGEEINMGKDGYITNPWNPDTDGDGLHDDQEMIPAGTNPTIKDTDGDGVVDGLDVDPLHNVLLQITVTSLHLTGDNPDTTNNFIGVGFAQDDPENPGETKLNCLYTAIGEGTTDGSHNSLFRYVVNSQYQYMTYTVDISDSNVYSSIDLSAWHFNSGGSDSQFDISSDTGTSTYTIDYVPDNYDFNELEQFVSDGDNVLTVTITKVTGTPTNTILLTSKDTNEIYTTPEDANQPGRYRYNGEQQFYIFTLDVDGTNGYFNNGYNTIIVPRAIFKDSLLYKRLTTATNANDLNLPSYIKENIEFGTKDMAAESGAETKFKGGIAGTFTSRVDNGNNVKISASNALSLIIEYLMEGKDANDNTIVTAKSLNITKQTYDAPLANININNDILSLIPILDLRFDENYLHAAPSSIWQKFADALNGLVTFVWNGLVAIGNFLVKLGEAFVKFAIAVWGAINSAVAKIGAAVAAAAKALADAVNWVINWIKSQIESALSSFKQKIKNAIKEYSEKLMNALKMAIEEYNSLSTISPNTVAFIDAILIGGLFVVAIGLTATLFAMTLLFTPFLFILVPITLIVVAVCIGILWYFAFDQTDAPPTAELPNINWESGWNDLWNSLKNSFNDDDRTNPVLAVIGLILSTSSWSISLYLKELPVDFTGATAMLGAFTFSIMGIAFGFMAKFATNPDDKKVGSIAGIVFSLIGWVLSMKFLVSSNAIPHLRLWVSLQWLLAFAGFAVSSQS